MSALRALKCMCSFVLLFILLLELESFGLNYLVLVHITIDYIATETGSETAQLTCTLCVVVKVN